MEKLPQDVAQYQWVVNMFKDIKGVEIIALNSQGNGSEINMMMTNNKTGPHLKTFTLPLRTDVVIDYICASNCLHEYDINTYPEAEQIIKIAMAKAKMIFEAPFLN